MAKTVWVITRKVNEYDQLGEYFHTVFENEPTKEDLEKVGVSHLGRVGDEHTWYHAREFRARKTSGESLHVSRKGK